MTQGYTEPTVNLVCECISANPGLVIKLPKGTILYRLQLAEHITSIHFNRKIEHRFADPLQRVGIMYMGFCFETTLLEYMQEWPVTQDMIDKVVVCKFALNRDLYVVDAPALNRCGPHNPLSNIVGRGDGPMGYAPTQALSKAIVGAQLPKVGGILYLSQAGCTASIESSNGKCLALFEGQGNDLLEIISRDPLDDQVLPYNETVVEVLLRNGVPCN